MSTLMSSNMNVRAMIEVFVMVLLASILFMAVSASADEVHELKPLIVPSFKVGCLVRNWSNSIFPFRKKLLPLLLLLQCRLVYVSSCSIVTLRIHRSFCTKLFFFCYCNSKSSSYNKFFFSFSQPWAFLYLLFAALYIHSVMTRYMWHDALN